MVEHSDTKSSRRGFLQHAAVGGGLSLGALMAGCNTQSQGTAGKRKPLKAAISNAGLAGTWNKRGQEATFLWGDLLDVEVKWYDGEFDGQTQLSKIEMMVDEEDWDFFAVQAHEIDILKEPVLQLKKRGVPVISMDTLIVAKDELRETGVWTVIAPDHRELAAASTQYMMEKIGGRGKVIHIGGKSTHSGAKQRRAGFEGVVAEYDGVEVLSGTVRWCDWKTELARSTFESFLAQEDEPIAGAFFHNDDMALACYSALEGTVHDGMVLTAVDGQETGLRGVADGELAATCVNPTSMIHGYAMIIGQFIVRNKEKMKDVPLEITLPSQLVSNEPGKIEAMLYLSDKTHCLL